MSALQISQLAPVNDLNELDVLDQESINGGLFGFSFPNLLGGTKTKFNRKTETLIKEGVQTGGHVSQNIFHGANLDKPQIANVGSNISIMIYDGQTP